MSMDEDAPRGDGESKLERGRRKLRTVGMLVILSGLFGLALTAGSLTIAMTQPMFLHDKLVEFIEKQPPSPQKQQQLDDLQRDKESMRLDSPTNIGFTAFTGLLCAIGVVGGIKMRSGTGYGLAMAGAICSAIPVAGCCCTGMPVGIWALIVLLSSDGKRVFETGAAEEYSAGPDGR
jgi:hypothetical protein